MRLLAPGGAGYIGSHFVRYAQRQGHEIIVLDNFSTGHRWAINDCEVIEVDLLNHAKLQNSLINRNFDGVIHFAGKSLVGESIKTPQMYFQNNVVGTINLIEVMLKCGCQNLVFSSTASLFGNPLTDKVREDHPKKPINPYGRSKLIVEQVLQDICSAYDFNACCFRYFNAAGADLSGEIGEAHSPETHLIPNVLAASYQEAADLKIFGNDYESVDGTCIRDYVHVNDLANAHLLGLDHMREVPGFSSFNLGNGNGYSVLEVIEASRLVTGSRIDYRFVSRRSGDPAVLVADSDAAKLHLGWNPEFSNLTEIVESAWKWHQFQKNSF